MVINATLHELTEEQVTAPPLSFNGGWDLSPKGEVFSSSYIEGKAQRRAWAGSIFTMLPPQAKNLPHLPLHYIIVGGDTAAMMMLAEERMQRHRTDVRFLAALQDRVRDENGRFVPNFKGWMEF